MAKPFASDRGKIVAYAAIVAVAVIGQIAIVGFGLSPALHEFSRSHGFLALDEYIGFAFRIAFDDFGTGYSILHSLRELPFDKVKIDRSFVASHSESRDSRKIVAAIIGLSHSLGLPTTAEGIECAADAEWLESLGCDQGQGFYYSPPLFAAEVDELLARTADATGVALACVC
jgi:EAL domain-containing protein (putative c-di-GMP-specific phosphodiesterase class I)